MVKREGFGDVLADGVERAAKRIGERGHTQEAAEFSILPMDEALRRRLEKSHESQQNSFPEEGTMKKRAAAFFTKLSFSLIPVMVIVFAVAIGSQPAFGQGAAKEELKINPTRTALLVVHMMNEQLNYKQGVSNYGPEFAEENAKLGIIPKTKAAIEASRAAGVMVIHVRMEYRPGYPEQAPSAEQIPGARRTRNQGFYKAGSWNVQIVDQLKPTEKDPDIVVVNHSISGFGYNELDQILRSNNIRWLVIAGLSTETVVTCTTIDARIKGYANYILRDCCNSRLPGGQEMYMTKVLPSYAVITDSSEYIEALKKIKK